MLQQSLEALWGHLATIGRPVVVARIPGPGLEDVKSALGEPIPDMVAQWFNWSNGVADTPGQTQDDASVMPGYWPLSIAEAKSIMSDYIDDEAALGDHWVPLLGSGGGDFYAAVFDESLHEVGVFTVMSGGETEISFRSVEEMVDGFLELYQTGVFYVDDDGTLEADDDRWVEYESRVGGTA
ncbi:hypothetical protein [Micromonospora sp. NPDC051006]|uniref:hypothetical protein n=1 Tax=Micromonospora sp. NPDC051006 TaxID=3364283 RepID=UPI0037B2BAD1